MDDASFKVEDMPLVSVVMATFNGEKFIEEQIQSIFNQSYKNIELIIQDDCSTDKTVEIIKSQIEFFPVRLEINSSRLGFVKNFESALYRSSGRYIALCDQDDIWKNSKILTLVGSMKNVDLVHTNCELIDEKGKLLTSSWKDYSNKSLTVEELVFRNYVTGCTLMFDAHLLNQALPFPKELAYHDWWLAILAANGRGVRYLDTPLIKYRQHRDQDTGAKINKNALIYVITRLLPDSRKKRKNMSRKQMKNLNTLFGIDSFKNHKSLIKNAYEYHESIVSDTFHFKAIKILFKNYKNIRPYQSHPLLRGLISDFIG